MGIRNKVTGEVYTITTYDPTTGSITGINNVGGNTDLGNVTTVFIGGGNPGEVLSTDGSGNLSWIAAGGGGNTGDITFVGTTISAPNEDDINIQALNNDGVINSGITFRPADTYTRWEQWGPQDSQLFTTADWTTGEYTTQGGGTIGAVQFTDATNIINFVNSLEGVGQIYFSVNGGPQLTWDGTSAGGTGITFYTPTLPATDPTTVTSFEYYYSYYTQVEIDYDAEEFNINTNNVDFLVSTTNQRDIELNSAGDATIIGRAAVSITNFSDLENVYITTDAANQAYQWQFGVDGNLRLPGNTFAVNYANGDPVPLGGGGANTGNVTFDDQIVIGTGDEFGGGGLYLAIGPTSAANLQYLRVRGGDYPTHIHLDTGNNAYYDQYFGDDNKYVKLANTGNIIIGAYQDGGPNAQWNFSYDGNLTVPGNIQSVTTGGFTSNIIGIDTGNPTVTVILADLVFPGPGTGQVTISGVVGTTEANGTWYFQATDTDRFELYTDDTFTTPVDGSTWTTYVSGGVAVSADNYSNLTVKGGNVEVVTNTGNTWTFTSDGNLRLPGGNSVIQSIANSSLDPLSPNASTMVFTPDQSYGSQALVLDPTSPGHIHLRAPAFNSNIDEPSANIFLGGETSSFEVGYFNGSTPDLYIHSNNNTWTFDSTGNLTIPGSSGGLIKTVANASIGIAAMDDGTDNPAQLMSWNVGSANPTTIISAYASNATIQSNVTGAINTWEFDNTGNLTLADGGFLVVSGGIVGGGASPAPYLSGFSSLATTGAQGNITASGFFVGDGGYLSNIAGGNVVGEVALANTVSNPSQPNITSVGTLVSLTTGALNTTGQFTANGNAQFNGDVFFTGNVTLPGTINQISGNSGSFFGDPATGFGALYVGIPAGYTILDNEVAQFSDNFDGYTQITHRNLNGGDQATGDFVITADNGTDLVNYIDLGMAGSGYDGTLANNSLGTALYPNDGYLYAQGDVTGGNLVLGSNQLNGVVRIIANGASNIGDTVATFAANGLTVASNVAASYFLGNGSQLTGMYGNTNVAAYLPGYTGQLNRVTIISASGNIDTSANINVTGNIYATYVLGNGSQLTDLPAPVVTQDITSVGDMSIMTYDGNIKYVNNATIEPATGDIASAGNIVAVGNVQGAYVLGNGSQLTSIAGSSVTGIVASASVASVANSIAGANVSGQVANAALADLATFATTANSVAGANVSGQVSNAALADLATFATTANSVAGANVSGVVANANYAAFSGQVVDSAQANITSVGTLTSLAVTGNVSADHFIGNGSQLTGVYGNTEVLSLLQSGNVGTIISNGGGNSTQTAVTISTDNNLAGFDTAGLITLTNNGALATNINKTIIIDATGNLQITDSARSQAILNLTDSGNLSVPGNIAADYFLGDGSQLSNIDVSAIANGNSSVSIPSGSGNVVTTVQGEQWVFDVLGQLLAPNFGGSGPARIRFLTDSIAIGNAAGETNQDTSAVAIGYLAGNDTQGSSAVAVGTNSGSINQGAIAVAVGADAGLSNQELGAVAIGGSAGNDSQGLRAVAIGLNAGLSGQGGNSIAIGSSAGETDQPASSIIINASGATLDGTESGLYIDPVRNDTGNTTNVVYYNNTTKEVTYGPAVTPAPSIGTMTSGANITPTTAVTQYNVTALAVASNVDAPTGTPADGQKLTIRILDNGSAQALTWNAIYEVIGTTLPTTTVANKFTYVGCIYNAQVLKWDVVSVAQQA
jgi:hypothetical protein